MRIITCHKILLTGFLAVLFVANAWALPPQVEADALALDAMSQMKRSDYAGAVVNFAKIEKLKVRVPATFNYHYGVALAGANQWVQAQKKLERYLTQAGAGGKFYKEALAKYNEVKPRAAFQKAEAKRLASLLAQAAKDRAKFDADVASGAIQTTFRDCEDCPVMVVIPLGSFDMGSTNGASDEKPQHRVAIAQAFALGKTEVTQGQWKAIMGSNPSDFQHCGDNCPVENVSWNDAQEFIRKLNAQTGKQYRLPSEAEWEYACRAGQQTAYCGSDDIGSVAWYGAYDNPVGNSAESTNPVASRQANAWGLYDMSGNVWEWVEDSYHESYNGAPADGSAWQGNGAERMQRGGSWVNWPQVARAASRSRGEPADRSGYYGFRLARMLP
jgi:formylglycine-generating enzyme required for sulfatase activity